MKLDLKGVVVGDRYRCMHLLGSGGMGEVWLADAAGERVALKVLTSDDGEDVERFSREARAIEKVHHENVVRVLASGTCANTGLHFLAMEVLHGETLRERMNAGAIDVKDTVGIVRQISKALAAAHAVNIVHRDVKPENVFLALTPKGELVKLLDFGIARGTSTGDTVTGTGFFMGTPAYAAPEVTMALSSNDPKSDLYSLGAVWFEMVSGRKVFVGSTAVEVALMHAQRPAPRLSSLVPSVPSPVDDLIDQMLAKDPKLRPPAAVLTRLLDLVLR